MTELMIAYMDADKAERKRIDSDYKKFIAGLPCLVTCRQSVELHHIRMNNLPAPFGAGMGLKPADIMCIPLSVDMHRGKLGIHSLGNSNFQNYHGLHLLYELERYHNKFMEEKW